MQAMDGRTMKIAALVAASVVASAIALYVLLAAQRPARVATQPAAVPASAPPAAAAAGGSARPLDQMAERLAARLAKDGGSAADWALLGRSYREMGRWPEAVQALEKSIALGAPDAQVQADLEAARAKAAAKP